MIQFTINDLFVVTEIFPLFPMHNLEKHVLLSPRFIRKTKEMNTQTKKPR